jgi:hypothetical protein
MAVRVSPRGVETATGVVLQEGKTQICGPLVVPIPKRPSWSVPQAQAWPVESRARLLNEPKVNDVKETPGGIDTATGTELSVMVPFPSSPSSLEPQPQARPVESRARIAVPPPEISLKVTPFGITTATGTELSVVVPFPSSPKPLSPQAHARPVESMAALTPSPADTEEKVTFGGIDTATGFELHGLFEQVSGPVVVPTPNSPLRLKPQAQAWPVASRAKLSEPNPSSPADIAVKVTPFGIDTATGTELSVVVPFPSWPKTFDPHAHA